MGNIILFGTIIKWLMERCLCHRVSLPGSECDVSFFACRSKMGRHAFGHHSGILRIVSTIVRTILRTLNYVCRHTSPSNIKLLSEQCVLTLSYVSLFMMVSKAPGQTCPIRVTTAGSCSQVAMVLFVSP